MNEIPTIELIECRNERIETVDQAMELAAMMPVDCEERLQLLRMAAKAWMMHESKVAIISSEVDQKRE